MHHGFLEDRDGFGLLCVKRKAFFLGGDALPGSETVEELLPLVSRISEAAWLTSAVSCAIISNDLFLKHTQMGCQRITYICMYMYIYIYICRFPYISSARIIEPTCFV